MELFDAEIMAKQLISEYVPNYRFAWSKHKRIRGMCEYTTKTIYLSRYLTPLRDKNSVRQTVMHEIAHAMNPGANHGKAWQLQMMRFGLPTARCSQDVTDVSSISNWVSKCAGCSKVTYMIRKPRVKRSCGKCSGGTYNKKYEMIFTRI